jgi:membrane protease subunit HflK
MNDDISHPGNEPGPPPSKKPAPPPSPVEDASAQALSEALRSSFNIVKFLMAGLVIAFIASGIFTVKPNQIAIKLRFGKPLGAGSERLLKPGLHWAFPYPIDEIVYVPVGESHTVTSTAGWYFQTAQEEAVDAEPQPKGTLQPGVDGYTLTGDGDIIHARATLTYRITDPISYVFDFADVTNLLQHVLDNALFYASARFAADDALYGHNKLVFQEAVLNRVNETIDKLKLGVAVEPREVRTSPPADVKKAFDGVLDAQQEGNIKIQQAESYARGATNKAVGEAFVITRDGLTRSNSIVQTVAAEAKSFNDLLPRYQSDPDLFTQRLLAETIQRVMTNAQFKQYLPDRPDGKPWELRLQLGKEPEIPKKETAKPD